MAKENFTIRFDPEVHRYLKERAKACDVSIGEYIRVLTADSAGIRDSQFRSIREDQKRAVGKLAELSVETQRMDRVCEDLEDRIGSLEVRKQDLESIYARLTTDINALEKEITEIKND